MPTPSIYSPAVARQVCDALSAGQRATQDAPFSALTGPLSTTGGGNMTASLPRGIRRSN